MHTPKYTLEKKRRRMHWQLGDGDGNGDGAGYEAVELTMKVRSMGTMLRATEGYIKATLLTHPASCYIPYPSYPSPHTHTHTEPIKTYYVRSFVRLFLTICCAAFTLSLSPLLAFCSRVSFRSFVSSRYVDTPLFLFLFRFYGLARGLLIHTHTLPHKYTEDIQKWQWRARPDNGWQ